MGIKTVPHPLYSPDLASCDFFLFPKLSGCRSLWDNLGDERGCDDVHWHAHTRGLPWGLAEVVGTVEQVHCSRRRLLRRGLVFHVYTINKSAHTKKSLETYLMILVYSWKVVALPVMLKVIKHHKYKTTQLFYDTKIYCSYCFYRSGCEMREKGKTNYLSLIRRQKR